MHSSSREISSGVTFCGPSGRVAARTAIARNEAKTIVRIRGYAANRRALSRRWEQISPALRMTAHEISGTHPQRGHAGATEFTPRRRGRVGDQLAGGPVQLVDI